MYLDAALNAIWGFMGGVMKKLLKLAGIAMILVGLTSCGEDDKKPSEKKTQVKAVTQDASADSVEEDTGAWFMAQTEKAPVMSVSASSELVETKFAGKFLYSPANILDGDFNNTWCESVDGDGIGETITVEFSEPVSFDEIQLVNGFAAKDSWEINNRIKVLEISQVAGEHIQCKEYTLEDGIKDWQSIKFEHAQTAQTIKFKIVDVYKGTQYEDTCLDDVRLLYRGKVIPFVGVEKIKQIQEEISRNMLNSDFDVKFKSLFKPAYNPEGQKCLILKAEDGSGTYITASGEGSSFKVTGMYDCVVLSDCSVNKVSSYIDDKNTAEQISQEASALGTLVFVRDDFASKSYELGNCKIYVKARVSYVDTVTSRLIRLDGDNVIINGVNHVVIPAESACVKFIA